MKTTFRKITGVALLLGAFLVSGTTFAQRGGQGGGQQGPPPMPTDDEIVEMVSELADGISLDELQEAGILQLYQDHFEEVESKMKSGRPDREEMEALKSDLEDGVNALLNEEQQELYKTYLKNKQKNDRR